MSNYHINGSLKLNIKPAVKHGDTCMPHLLQESHQDGDEVVSLLLQCEERPRRSHKQLCLAVRNVVLETVLDDDGLHSFPVWRHQVVWPGVLARHFIPEQHSARIRDDDHISVCSLTSNLGRDSWCQWTSLTLLPENVSFQAVSKCQIEGSISEA